MRIRLVDHPVRYFSRLQSDIYNSAHLIMIESIIQTEQSSFERPVFLEIDLPSKRRKRGQYLNGSIAEESISGSLQPPHYLLTELNLIVRVYLALLQLRTDDIGRQQYQTLGSVVLMSNSLFHMLCSRLSLCVGQSSNDAYTANRMERS